MENEEILDAIEERINALEEEVRKLRGINARLCVVLACLIALVVASYLILVGKELKLIRVLRVERIEFVRDGKLIAAIAGERTLGLSSSLGIYDKDGIRMVVIGSTGTGPFAGSQGLFLGPAGVGGGVGFFVTPDGNGRMEIWNKYGKRVVLLGALSELEKMRVGDGYLIICDKDGNKILSASIDPEHNAGKLQISRTPGQGDTEKAAVAIGVLPGGSGVIATTNSLGLPIWTSPLR